MASCASVHAKTLLIAALVLLNVARFSLGARRLPELPQAQLGDELSYHGGAVLHGDIPVSIIWYGQFKPAQKAIVVDFVLSLTSMPQAATPSAAQWWGTNSNAYLSNATGIGGSKATRILLANQAPDDNYSLGKSLTLVQMFQLAAGALPKKGAIVLVLTDPDVVVEGFCSMRCGLHGSDARAGYAYAWVGNAERQCPGQCAWPFAKPAYGPQNLPLGAPNGDVGVDGMMVTLASMVAAPVTNPFGDGYYQGDKDAALEACTACAGVYGSGSYPGYAGKVLVDKTNGCSYNAIGANGHKFLLPAIYNQPGDVWLLHFGVEHTAMKKCAMKM